MHQREGEEGMGEWGVQGQGRAAWERGGKEERVSKTEGGEREREGAETSVN